MNAKEQTNLCEYAEAEHKFRNDLKPLEEERQEYHPEHKLLRSELLDYLRTSDYGILDTGQTDEDGKSLLLRLKPSIQRHKLDDNRIQEALQTITIDDFLDSFKPLQGKETNNITIGSIIAHTIIRALKEQHEHKTTTFILTTSKPRASKNLIIPRLPTSLVSTYSRWKTLHENLYHLQQEKHLLQEEFQSLVQDKCELLADHFQQQTEPEDHRTKVILKDQTKCEVIYQQPKEYKKVFSFSKTIPLFQQVIEDIIADKEEEEGYPITSQTFTQVWNSSLKSEIFLQVKRVLESSHELHTSNPRFVIRSRK